ncbi:phosphatase PAP2 family protein [Candidatus Micrarchaeota archaeon]|nr:phosphatase PAP2 family protein [Candidatus Micrarchaeota archaeon]
MKIEIAEFLGKNRHSSLISILLRGLALYYLVLLSLTFANAYLQGGNFILAPDHVFFLFFSMVIILEKGGEFLLSVSKYFILFFSFYGMRGMADNLNPYVNFTLPIRFDEIVFGQASVTGFLQQNLAFLAPHVDTLAILTYSTHFFIPFLFGFLLWVSSRKSYEPYFISLVFTIYLGLVTFLLVPVAPPWMAADRGLIELSHLTLVTSVEYGFAALPSIYFFFNANPVAAFPSLHFAFPLLAAYFSYRAFGRKGLLALIYPALMAFSLVYLGEHYVFDLLGGVAYAGAGIFCSGYVTRAYEHSLLSRIYELL